VKTIDLSPERRPTNDEEEEYDEPSGGVDLEQIDIEANPDEDFD